MNTLSKQNKILIGIGFVVVAGLLFWWGRSSSQKNSSGESSIPQIEIQTTDTGVVDEEKLNLNNNTYVLDGTAITLSNGIAKQLVAGGSATMTTTLIPGTAYGDVTGDGVKDAVVLLRNEAEGTGVFYYAALVSLQDGVSKTSKAVLLGDRIRIHQITLHPHIVMIDIRERGMDSSFVGVPDVPKALVYEVLEGELSIK